jgi:hypothetical protein
MNYFHSQLRRIVAAAQVVGRREPFDVLLVSNRPEYFDIGDQDAMFQIRARSLAEFLFVWTFDNHHSAAANLAVNALADVVVPSHKYCARFMRTPCTLLGFHVPLSTNQWSRATARRLFANSAHLVRQDGLHGGFISWEIGERNKLLQDCRAKLPSNAITLIDNNARQSYFDQSPEQRWHDWASHKVGFILPVTFDLSGRLFDSLLTGQVPIVPTWCHDLDEVISTELQNSLPVIRFDTASVEAVESAWQKALQRFDADGHVGALRRHSYAVDNHHLINRIQAICAQVKVISKSEDITFAAEPEGMGFDL